MSDMENVEQFVGQLKVIQLRDELKKRQLPYTGHKKVLAQRLQEALLKEKEQQNEDAEAEEEESADTVEEGDEEEEAEEQAAAEKTPQDHGDREEIETTSTMMEEPQAAEKSEIAEKEAKGETAAADSEQMESKEEEPAAVVADGNGDMETGGSEEKEDFQEEKTDKVDPSKAPDPEEPEKFDESALRKDIEEQFSCKSAKDDVNIGLDRYNSDLYFKINPDGLGGCNLSNHGFAYLWAEARATWGVKGGKYFFEVRVEENMEVELPDTQEHPHAIRVGWSPDESELCLGEVLHSYGYGGTGKSSMNNNFETYGEPYGPGDVIGCFLDLESSPRTISFSKNGQHFEKAFTLEEGELKDKALFPHVATKNVKMSLNFSAPAWNKVEGMEGYMPLQDVTGDNKIRAIKGPTSASECEVLMMIGLPASGKTTWAEKHCRDHLEKRFNILSTNLIMDKMKVSGLARKQNYHGALIKQSTKVLNAMFLLAGKNLRNYIIDQTSVYDGAQRRKMSYFNGFTKKAVVVVPPHHVLRQRTAKRNSEIGQPVPKDAINAMKANFHVPTKGGIFEDVVYTEIFGLALNKIVRQYREDALGLPSYPTSKRGHYNRGPSDRRGRFGPPRRGGGYSPYPPYGCRPSYPPYHCPSPPPHHMDIDMYSLRGGYGGGSGPYGHHHSPYVPRPYGGCGGYGPPPHTGGGGGYYGRY